MCFEIAEETEARPCIVLRQTSRRTTLINPFERISQALVRAWSKSRKRSVWLQQPKLLGKGSGSKRPPERLT